MIYTATFLIKLRFFSNLNEDCAVIGAILISSDEYNNRVNIVEELRSLGYRIIEAETGARVIELIRRYKNISLAFIDTALPDIDSFSLVKELRLRAPHIPIVLLYSEDSLKALKLEMVTQAMEAGADYLIAYNSNKLQIKAISSVLISYKMLEHNVYYKSCIDSMTYEFTDFVAHSESMKKCLKQAKLVSEKDTNIFIDGEPGTGRRQLAQAIHNADLKRNEFPFVAFYCDLEASDKNIIEAWQTTLQKYIKEVNKGTLCLINVDLLTKTQQAYVNKELQNLEFRLICLVTSDPQKWQKTAQLTNFFSKLKADNISVPPLRKRREDIEELAQKILWQFATQMRLQQKITGLTGAANELLMQYDWFGNISELEKALYHALLISDGPLLKVKDFPKINGEADSNIETFEADCSSIFFKEDGHIKTLETIEQETIEKAIEHYRGSLSEVARRLKIGRSTLYRKLDKN